MSSSRRIERVNSLLKEVLSEVIRKDLKSHTLPDLLTITNVDVSKDLRYAKVYISIIEDNTHKKEEILQILQDAAGYIAVLASKKVVLRYFPSLTFKLDTSIDKYMEIDQLLRRIEEKRGKEEAS
ncbi:MAG: 30S ribosome-binding factor RbfA [Verrucomicrobia bacterium]|jgi:ribosome-binding factor A|nr:30S ribosome-binding factor RbfA [Verrucomicrobiota bacterium]